LVGHNSFIILAGGGGVDGQGNAAFDNEGLGRKLRHQFGAGYA